MKSLVLNIMKVLAWLPGKMVTCKVSLYWHLLCDSFYAEFVRHRFKKAPFIKMFGFPIEVQGGKYIEIGHSTILGKDCRLEALDEYYGQRFSPEMIIGEHAVINPLCHIGCINKVFIGNYVTIGERSLIVDHTHGGTIYDDMLLSPRKRPLFSKGPVVIEDNVTLGENCVVLPGVTIGHNSVIGANAVVTKNIPPFSIVGGNPAKVIKTVVPC